MPSPRECFDSIAVRLIVPIVGGLAALTVIGALYLNHQSARTIHDQTVQSARSIAFQIGQDREQYTRKMEAEGLDPMYLHEIGTNVNGKGLYQVKLLGMWPIDSSHAARDDFERQAMERLLADPNAEPVRMHRIDGAPFLTFVRAEMATSQTCVDCHVSSLSGATNQIAKDKVMGALVIDVPVGAAQAAARRETWTVIGALVLVMILLAGVMLKVVGAAVQKPVMALLPAVEPLADGDFSHEVTVCTRGEIGRIASALEGTRTRVAGVLGDLKGTVGSVREASHQLASRANGLAAGSQEQAAALEQTSASLAAMTSTVRENSDRAQEAKRLAATTSEQAARGAAVVNEAVTAMSGITAASRRIGDISTTIDEIAFQTNLLALNAAVEAARAGAQGRSFAVVASEVRALAQRSGAASKEIRGLIQDAISQVEGGNAMVVRAGETLGGIVGEVKQVASLVAGIADASTSQARGIEQVSRAVEQMDQVTQQTASQTEDLDTTARELADQAEHLRTQIEQFRLDARSGGAPTPVKAPATSTPAARPSRATPSALRLVPRTPARRAAAPQKAPVRTGTDEEFQEF
jgi:methyl-accepting chemotaxis protein